jgi:hypothetical protein
MEQADNAAVIETFFKGVASGDYYDGRCYRLYFDADDNSIFQSIEASENSWLERDGLHELHRVSGYWDGSEEDRYNDDVHDISDFGWSDWYDMIESKLKSVLSA